MAEDTAPNLEPNPADMQRHLELLFGQSREYEDGLIEIAVNTGKGWLGQLFAIDEIPDAVAFAARRNQQRCNVYVGVALRDPDVPLIGRCDDGDHYATTTVGGDLDTEEASAAAPARTRALPPSFIVCTGKHPHTRLQPFWSLSEAITDPDQHRAIYGGIADSLDGDRAVTNPSRVMRLAGSIAWPTKPGRVPELTSLVPLKYAPKVYTADEIARAYPASDKLHTINPGHKNDPIERQGGGSLGLGAEQVTDGRHAYMRDTILAVFGELVGTTGAAPSPQELYEAAWPQYSAHVDLSRPGRGPDVFARMCASTLRRFDQGRLRGRGGKILTLDGLVEDWRAREAKRNEKALEAIGITSQPETSEMVAAAKADQDALILNGKGNPIWCMANALFVLRNHADWHDVLAYNEFTGRSVLLKPIPGTTPLKADFPRDMRDGDYTAATVWFNQAGFHTAAKQVTADALEMAAQDSVIHPVRQYLKSLAWDGKPRLRSWLQVYCGAEVTSEDHARYVQEAGYCWAISAVARIFRPGCKADAALILEGRQGCGKSRGLKALAGPEFFGDSLPPMTSKDASTYLRGLWIIELAELSNINKAEVEHIKAFITRTEERFRPPYGRNEIAFPRQCVFAGTTNRDDYLRDDTGNRRFWPITVTEIDVEAIEEDRDQIWAEAVHHFRSGEQWHMAVDVLDLAHDQQSERQADDPWGDAIAEFLRGRKSASPSMLAVECLGIDIGRVNRGDQNRIVSILRQMGWKKAGRITKGRDYKGQFRYERGDA